MTGREIHTVIMKATTTPTNPQRYDFALSLNNNHFNTFPKTWGIPIPNNTMAQALTAEAELDQLQSNSFYSLYLKRKIMPLPLAYSSLGPGLDYVVNPA